MFLWEGELTKKGSVFSYIATLHFVYMLHLYTTLQQSTFVSLERELTKRGSVLSYIARLHFVYVLHNTIYTLHYTLPYIATQHICSEEGKLTKGSSVLSYNATLHFVLCSLQQTRVHLFCGRGAYTGELCPQLYYCTHYTLILHLCTTLQQSTFLCVERQLRGALSSATLLPTFHFVYTTLLPSGTMY